MLGVTVNSLNLFIEQCGGNKSLFGKTIFDVYFEFIQARANNNKEEGEQLSLCEIDNENLNSNNSKNSVFYIHSSHNYLFLDVYESILDFINNSPNNNNSRNNNNDIILWWDIFSSITTTFDATATTDKNIISNQIYNASSLIHNTIFIVSPRYEYIHSAIGWTLFIYKHLQMILSSTYTPRDGAGDNNSDSTRSDNNMCIYEVLFTTQIYSDRYLHQQKQQPVSMQTDAIESTDDTTAPTTHSPYLSTVIDAIHNTDIILTHINTIIQLHTPSKAHTTSTSYTQKGHNSDSSEIENKLDDLIIYIALLHQDTDKHSIIAAFTKIATYDLLSYTQTLLQQLYDIHTDIYSNTNTNSNNSTHTKHTTHSINSIDTTTNNTTTADPTLNSPDTVSPSSTSTSSNEVEKEGREDKAFFDYTTTQSLHLSPLVSLGFVDYYDDDIHRGQNYDHSGGGKRVRREKGGGEGDYVRGILEKQNSNNSNNSTDVTSTASTYPSPRDPHSVADSTASTTTPTTTTALTAEMSLHIRLRYLLTVPSQLEHIVNNADLISLQSLINNVFLPQCVIKTSSLPEPGQYMYVCMYCVYMYVCLYVCMYICMYVCIYV